MLVHCLTDSAKAGFKDSNRKPGKNKLVSHTERTYINIQVLYMRICPHIGSFCVGSIKTLKMVNLSVTEHESFIMHAGSSFLVMLP